MVWVKSSYISSGSMVKPVWICWWATSSSLWMFSPVRAVMGITGTPRAREMRSMSSLSPRLATSSMKLSAMTMGRSSSSSWAVR